MTIAVDLGRKATKQTNKITGTSICIRKGIHMLMMHGLFHFTHTRSGALSKMYVINSNVCRSEGKDLGQSPIQSAQILTACG